MQNPMHPLQLVRGDGPVVLVKALFARALSRSRERATLLAVEGADADVRSMRQPLQLLLGGSQNNKQNNYKIKLIV